MAKHKVEYVVCISPHWTLIYIQHPYKLAAITIRKFQVVTNTLAQVTWNFVNHG
jgi:hypothetical protein